MINVRIASYLADSIRPIQAISRLAGLVKVLVTDTFTKGKDSRFPIDYESTLSDCAHSGRKFPDLVPDSRERLIIYFEEISPAKCLNGSTKWQSQLRLVAWGNNSLFLLNGATNPDTTTILIATIIKHLKDAKSDLNSPIGNLKVSVASAPPSGANLFSPYTYSETLSQYLLPPYFAFGLDLTISFTLAANDCLDTLTYLTPDSDC